MIKMSIEHLKTLSLNPFFMGKVIQNFLEGYGSPIEYKLIFYVLPIVLYKESRDKLSSAKKTSRIETLFGGKQDYSRNKDIKISGKINLSGFLERFEELKEITKLALIVLSTEEKVLLSKEIYLKEKDNYQYYAGEIKSTLRAAYYLGVIFSKTSSEHLDYFLGVSVA